VVTKKKKKKKKVVKKEKVVKKDTLWDALDDIVDRAAAMKDQRKEDRNARDREVRRLKKIGKYVNPGRGKKAVSKHPKQVRRRAKCKENKLEELSNDKMSKPETRAEGRELNIKFRATQLGKFRYGNDTVSEEFVNVVHNVKHLLAVGDKLGSSFKKTAAALISSNGDGKVLPKLFLEKHLGICSKYAANARSDLMRSIKAGKLPAFFDSYEWGTKRSKTHDGLIEAIVSFFIRITHILSGASRKTRQLPMKRKDVGFLLFAEWPAMMRALFKNTQTYSTSRERKK